MEKKRVHEQARELENVLGLFRRAKFASKEKGGVKKAECLTLMLLAGLNDGKPVMPSEIAKKMGVTLAAVTHHINALEEKGYVERTASKEDRRVTFIAFSGKGRKLVKALKKEHDQRLLGMVEYLGEKDTAELVRIFTRVVGYMSKVKE